MKTDLSNERKQGLKTGQTVSIVIPTYKERNNLLPLLDRIKRSLQKTAYRVLFIDDNSQDGTDELIKDIQGSYPVELLVRKDKKGLASAVVDGLARVKSDIAVVMDADLQHPPEVLPDMLMEINDGADLVIASRYVPGGSSGDFSFARRIVSSGATFLAHLFLFSARRVKDPMSGFFALRKTSLDGARLSPAGYKILLEVLCLGNFRKVAEVPFTFQMRSAGESKLNARQQIEYLKHLFSLMRRTGELSRILKFSLVGISGVIVNEGLLFLLRGIVLLPLWFASAVSIESSIISNFVLNEIFTFRDRHIPGTVPTLKRLSKFNLISLGGLGINLGILTLLVTVFHVNYLLANLIGIFVAFSWNFILNSWWTWKEKGTEIPETGLSKSTKGVPAWQAEIKNLRK